MTRREFLRYSSLTLGGSALAAGLYTWRVEPHWLELVRRPLSIEGLPAALHGATLALLADVHVGPRVADAYVLDVFARVSALRPDLVCYAGDFIDREAGVVAHAARVFANGPHGRLATIGILGNHDYGYDWAEPALASELAKRLSDVGIRVLRNEVVSVEGLQIAGLDDLWAGRFQPHATFAHLDPSVAAVALTHNPDTLDLLGWEGFRGWVFAGHTHGGQCKPPFLPPPLLPVLNKRYTAGEFAIDAHRRLYISRGVGHLLEVRFNVRPEVTLFTLRPG